jgi:hypothetical protein
MVRQTRILLLVSLELFLLAPLHTTVDFLRSPIGSLIKPLNNKEVGIMADILGINGITGTFTERQKIHRIQQVRFPHAVLSEKAVQLGRE